ncbi:MAG: thermonuclease family protein [Deltaproteobacteria bacterium]|nr:thermonuclease family protein [Deltaproteobacteria bacterium]
MPESLVRSNDYRQLVADLSAIILRGQQQAMSAVNEIRLKTYWEMGQKISEAQAKIDPAASETFISQLSVDLKVDKSLLYRIVQFYGTWPNGVPSVDGAVLSWTHHVELLSLKDNAEREFYLTTASKEGWGRNALRKAVQKDYYKTIRLQPSAEQTGTLKRDPNPLYVYKAVVEDVVDGDTLLVRIDLGFSVWVSQRIRFRGINTAELVKGGVPVGTAPERGEQAKAFVQEKLTDIPFIVVKTYKTDMYGRFVADVFYHPTISKKEEVATKGIFLNQELLSAGLADLML